MLSEKFMNGLQRFKSWVRQNGKSQGMVCHFYYAEKESDSKNRKPKQKPHYSKIDYAYFNLFSKSKDWLIKGTTGHGIRDDNNKKSDVPVLNCYEIDDYFYDALRQPPEEWIADYELGIILDKAELKRHFGRMNVKHIKPWYYGDPYPPPSRTWCYDKLQERKGSLEPFNFCNVVRVKIRRRKYLGLPIKTIPRGGVLGMLVKRGSYHVMCRLLKQKKWSNVAVFPLLPE